MIRILFSSILPALYKVKTMCQTWTILSQAIIKHKAQFQNNTDGSPSHPPRSATFSYQFYLAMILGCPSLKFLPITCNLLLHDFESNEMWVRSAPLRHRVRHRFREAPHESGLSLWQKGANEPVEWCKQEKSWKKDCEARSWELEVIFATVWMCLSGFLGLGMNLR